MKKIFMISGYMQSGKDLIGAYLIESFNFERFAFADSLKDEVASIYDINRDLMDTGFGKEQKTKYNGTVREILIRHGNYRRSIDSYYWSNKTLEQIKKSKSNNFVVTDFRFPDEYLCLKERTTIDEFEIFTIRVNRYCYTTIPDISETSLDQFKFSLIVENYGSKSELYTKIRNFTETIPGGLIKKPLILIGVDDILLNFTENLALFLEKRKEILCTNENYTLKRCISKRQIYCNEIARKFIRSPEYAKLEPLITKDVTSKLLTIANVKAFCYSEGIRPLRAKKRNLIENFGTDFNLKVFDVGSRSEKTFKDFFLEHDSSFVIDDDPKVIKVAEICGHSAFLLKKDWNVTQCNVFTNTLENFHDIINLL
jgi:hypothetical protein